MEKEVSKFMGHSSVTTTSMNYWVPTALELHDKMVSPFTGQFQNQIAAADESKEELEIVHDKLDAALNLFAKQTAVLRTAAANGDSAAQALEHFTSLVPNADGILRQIAESTSASISGVQERSRGPRQGGGDIATAAGDTSDSSDEDPDCEDEASSVGGVGHHFSDARGSGSGRKRKSGE